MRGYSGRSVVGREFCRGHVTRRRFSDRMAVGLHHHGLIITELYVAHKVKLFVHMNGSFGALKYEPTNAAAEGDHGAAVWLQSFAAGCLGWYLFILCVCSIGYFQL